VSDENQTAFSYTPLAQLAIEHLVLLRWPRHRLGGRIQTLLQLSEPRSLPVGQMALRCIDSQFYQDGCLWVETLSWTMGALALASVAGALAAGCLWWKWVWRS